MKLYLALSTLLAAAQPLAAQTGSPAVVRVAPATVAAALAAGGTVAESPGLIVMGSHRAATGQVEIHDKETDVLYVVDGEATIVTGGEVVGRRQSRAHQWLGTAIQGGEAHHLEKGEVLVVPAGVPHWFKEVPASISYFVVKVVAP